MSGYTPLFSSLTTGTLCGKWPDIGLWPIILSMSDRHGIVDVTPQYIAGVTGLPLQDVIDCLQRFCSPDPYSRTLDAQGARLELIEAGRDWGWRIVNHAKYREKARKAAYDASRTASGADAERKRTERFGPRPDASRDVPTRPASSRSQTQTQIQTKRKSRANASASPPPVDDHVQQGFDPSTVPHLDVSIWNRWVAYRAERKPPLKSVSLRAAAEELAKFGIDQAAVVQQSIANGWQGLFPLKAQGAPAVGQQPVVTHESRERTALKKLCDRRDAIGLSEFRDPYPGETSTQYRLAQDQEWAARKSPPKASTATSMSSTS